MSPPVSPDLNARSSASSVSAEQTGPARLGVGTEADGAVEADAVPIQTRGGRVYRLETWLVRRVLQAMGGPPIRVVLWNGREIRTSDTPPVARLFIRDRRTLLKLILNPDLHFGDAYVDGRIEVEGSLLQFLEAFYRAKSAAGKSAGLFRAALSRWLNRQRCRSIAGARKNIHHHYDVGNDFYRLWFDDEMVYSCAYFPTPQTTLHQAQLAKMDYVCRKLGLKPGETVVDVGSGWGAMALYMAKRYGARVKAFNVSHAQTVYARGRAKSEGLDSWVEFIEDDYRNISGRFDVFISLGMLEHVGANHYRQFGKVIDGCLGPSGRGLMQSIGQDQPTATNPWIDRRIFPGAYPPTLSQMMDLWEPYGFSVLDVENLRLHYAETLRHWLGRFDSAADAVAKMFDGRFVRTWRLYLTGSIGAFTTGTLQLFQIVFARPSVNNIPWTRAGLYSGPGTTEG